MDIFLRVVRPSSLGLAGAALGAATGVGVAGLGATVLVATGATGAGVATGAVTGVGAGAALAAPTVILAMSEPMLTSSPSGVMI